MMLVAEIADLELPAGRATIVATHIESRTTPGKRAKQLEELLGRIKSINTSVTASGLSRSPTTFARIRGPN